MNAAWHAQNPLPKRATEAQRIAWHLEHRQACACRPIPEKLQARMRTLAQLERKLTRSAPRGPGPNQPKRSKGPG